MKQLNHTFNLKQREAFNKLLAQAKVQAQKELEDDYALNRRVEEELTPELAKEYGASELMANVRSLSRDLDQAKAALGRLGFSCDGDGDLSIDYKAPKPLREALEAAKRSARTERDQVLKEYDLAIINVLASEDVQEAKKIVEELL